MSGIGSAFVFKLNVVEVRPLFFSVRQYPDFDFLCQSFEMEDGNRCFTVDEALVGIGFGKFQLYVLAYAGMGMVAEAMEMMLLSFVGPAVQSL
ncbi:hypothetical protein Bca52824_095785 [Brassica carinata]|uniref:Uncharacterized protein n=1 Tax=Brassica carinata TaxID=52824 RepID=A0A8X7P1I6_BRACI|nr:hypothetical protein Bca52824_095785 [Brassica carinata]